jgi:hypothetical protein
LHQRSLPVSTPPDEALLRHAIAAGAGGCAAW